MTNCKKLIISLLLVFALGGIFAYSQEIYWDTPQSLTKNDSYYPKTITNGNKSYLIWQEVDTKNQQIYLSLRSYKNLKEYSENKRFAGPFSYSGANIPDLFSAVVNDNGQIVVTALDSISGLFSFSSKDDGKTFTQNKIESSEIMLAPRIYVDSDGNYRVFTSVGADISFSIYTSLSKDGEHWSEFEEFQGSKDMRLPFTPYLISYKNTDYVVFQAQYLIPGQQKTSYQLYLSKREKQTGEGFHNEWSKPVLLTNEKSYTNREHRKFYEYQNQRPFLYIFQGKLYLTWERSENNGNTYSSIYFAQMDETGIIQDTLNLISNKGNASRGILFSYKKELYVTWFDNQTIRYAKQNGSVWVDYNPIETAEKNVNSRIYSYPLLITDSDDAKNELLTFVYQQISGKSNEKNTIGMVGPDKFAAPPELKALNFRTNRHSRVVKPTVQINFPLDNSGIRGYSYSWSTDETQEPLKVLTNTSKENKLTLNSNFGDDFYYLKVRILDKAGNWSEPAGLSYYLDTTPPAPPVIKTNNLDKFNLLKSNSYQFSWEPSVDEDTVSYLYSIENISNIPRILYESKKHPLKISNKRLEEEAKKLEQRFLNEKNRLEEKTPKTSTKRLFTERYYNKGNGLYALCVSAVDDVGNISKPSIQMFILNKFEPSTYITACEIYENQNFEKILTIYGGGFTYDGTITKIILDKDGVEPYDMVLEAQKNQFKVLSNTKITNINIGQDLEEGNYSVYLLHSDRGLYKYPKAIYVKQNGTVKIEPEYIYTPKYSQDFVHLRYKLSIYVLLVILIVVFGFFILIFATYNLQKSAVQNKDLRLEIDSLITGVPMSAQASKTKSKRQKSLKNILVRFTYLLIVAIVLAVSLQSGYSEIELQKNTLSSALEERSQVLLESLSTNVNSFMPAERITEISSLPSLKNAMKEAKYVTIIGQKAGSGTNKEIDFVWASDDPEINEKISSDTIYYGSSKTQDPDVEKIVATLFEMESMIKKELEPLESELERISKDLNIKTPETDPDYNDLLLQETKLSNQINAKLKDYEGKYAGSIPFFNKEIFTIWTTEYDYVFYRPVLYRQRTSREYVHAVIIMKISIESLIHSIQVEARNIIITAIVIAVVAVIAGLIGSLLLASLIIKPVKLLEEFVDRFGRAKVKKNYNKAVIKIKNRREDKKNKEEKNSKKETQETIELKDDEIGRLGIAINRMKDQIIQNEIEMGLQLDGSEVQNSFLPLEKGKSYSKFEDQNIQTFGYYQAQTGVSGDCYDYKKLDDEWYIFLKSDASGHGSPAAFIMTVVATFFKEYVKNWTFKKNGTNINEVVYKINDFIFNLGLRGKFATMLVALLNIKTGDLYLCNAGDNLVNIYRAKQKKVEVITLNSCPTTGVFDSDMIRMGTGYKVEKNKLEHGDVLFLYTDGIEESTRRVRNADFTVQQTQTESMRMNEETHKRETVVKLEDKKEEFGPERVRSVIEAVFNKQKFQLTKEENPMPGEILEFDFTKTDTSLHDVIFALASCEKVFRLYKPNGLHTGVDYIEIDREIDDFLSKYFNLYEQYAKQKEASPEKENFLNYDLMLEDEQGDDLTLLAMKRL